MTPDTVRTYNKLEISKRKGKMDENSNNNSGKTKSVMIVEDDDTIRKILAIECKRKGYDVLEFRDAASATSMIERNRPKIDVAIVDLMNLGYGGNLGQYLRNYQEYKKTRIIYYTALTEKQFNVNILDMPDVHYVHKVPGSVKNVIELLEQPERS